MALKHKFFSLMKGRIPFAILQTKDEKTLDILMHFALEDAVIDIVILRSYAKQYPELKDSFLHIHRQLQEELSAN